MEAGGRRNEKDKMSENREFKMEEKYERDRKIKVNKKRNR